MGPRRVQPLQTKRLTFRINHAAFSPDGRLLALALDDGGVSIWDPLKAEEHVKVKAEVVAVCVALTGTALVMGGIDGVVRIHPLDGSDAVEHDHGGTPECVAVAPDLSAIAAGGPGRLIQVWDADGQARMTVQHQGWFSRIMALAFSPDGTLLASADRRGTIRLWHWTTATPVRTVHHGSVVTTLAFSPDGLLLSAGGQDRNLTVWEVTTGRRIRLLWHGSVISCITFSQDSALVCSGGKDGLLRPWDLTTGRELLSFDGGVEEDASLVYAAAFTAEGQVSLVSLEDKYTTLRVWQWGRAEAGSAPAHP